MTTRKVLITSVGSGVGSAILQAINISDQDYFVTGLNSTPYCSSLYACDEQVIVSPTKDKIVFMSEVLEVVSRKRPKLIFVGRDEDISIIKELSPELNDLGVSVVYEKSNPIDFICDKYEAWKALKEMNIPIAVTAFSRDEIYSLINQCGFPLIVKPKKGNASNGINFVFTKEQLNKINTLEDEVILQEYLIPIEWDANKETIDVAKIIGKNGIKQEHEYSGQIIIGKCGQPICVFATKNILRNGVPTIIEFLDKQAPFYKFLREIASPLGKRGLKGCVNIQAKQIKKDYFVIFELNARCTGITGMRANVGFNEVDIMYEHFVLGNEQPTYMLPSPDLWAYGNVHYEILDRSLLENLMNFKR